jgi:hypothetical protein
MSVDQKTVDMLKAETNLTSSFDGVTTCGRVGSGLTGRII